MGGTSGYERVWCPIRRERLLTHRLAVGLPPNGMVVHHFDRNKTNNDPRNLLVMSRSEHYSHHGNELWDQRRDALRDGHKRYIEERGREVSREVMLRTWEYGKFGPRRAVCAVEGCDRTSNARGMCDMHYQRAKRRGVLPDRMEKLGENHRVLRVTRVAANEEVYDITVPDTENFALATGVFVHNSKDCADAVASVVFGLRQNAARLPWEDVADTKRKAADSDNRWVSDMIPAEEVDMDDILSAGRSRGLNERVMVPFFIGDD